MTLTGCPPQTFRIKLVCEGTLPMVGAFIIPNGSVVEGEFEDQNWGSTNLVAGMLGTDALLPNEYMVLDQEFVPGIYWIKAVFQLPDESTTAAYMAEVYSPSAGEEFVTWHAGATIENEQVSTGIGWWWGWQEWGETDVTPEP